MIKFLLKGILRDRSRSLFPLLTVAAGAFIMVFAVGYISGARNDFLGASAAFSTGHVKVMTNAYAKDIDLTPNELAILSVDSVLSILHKTNPTMIWSPRIKFGGLLDIPDKHGETREQAVIAGMAINLSSGRDVEILNIAHAIVQGGMPSAPNEILISDELAAKMKVSVGDTATLVGSTMYGSLAMHNFTIAGTVRFGITPMDRGAIIANLSDVQDALDMKDAAGEILGFFPDLLYHDEQADQTATAFTAQQDSTNEFALQMIPLADQNGLRSMINMMDNMSGILTAILIFAMSIVLWNAGLMGSLRRYGEIGLRLAVGEAKGHVYRSLLGESVIIGIGGSIVGTILGLLATWYLQVKGIDISSLTQNSSMMMSNIIRAQIVPACLYTGLIPGVIAPLIGTSISGIGIYRRETTQLFKELEV